MVVLLSESNAASMHLDAEIQDKIRSQLAHKDEKLKEAEYEQELLKSALEELEHKVVEGGHKAKDQELQQKIKIRKQQQKLKKQKERERQLRIEKERVEVEKAMIDSKVDRISSLLKETKVQYEDAQAEIEDLKEEFESERYDFLMTIRKQQKELQLYKQVAQKFLHADFLITNYGKSIEKVKENAAWDDDHGKWRLPSLKNTSAVVKLPGLEEQKGSKKHLSNSNFSSRKGEKLDNMYVHDERGEEVELFNEDGTFSPALLSSVNDEISGNSYSDISADCSLDRSEKFKGSESQLKRSNDAYNNSSFWTKAASQANLKSSISQERKMLEKRSSRKPFSQSSHWSVDNREAEISSPRNCTGSLELRSLYRVMDLFG